MTCPIILQTFNEVNHDVKLRERGMDSHGCRMVGKRLMKNEEPTTHAPNVVARERYAGSLPLNKVKILMLARERELTYDNLTAQDKQVRLLSQEAGHFSLVRALHLADFITELNGTLLAPLPTSFLLKSRQQ